MKNIYTKEAFRRFVIGFIVLQVILFVVSFFQSAEFMARFTTDVLIATYATTVVFFAATMWAYWYLFFHMLEKKWAFYLILVLIGLTVFDVVYELGLLIFVNSVSPSTLGLVADALNLPLTIGTKVVHLIMSVGSIWYIISYKNNHKKRNT